MNGKITLSIEIELGWGFHDISTQDPETLGTLYTFPGMKATIRYLIKNTMGELK